MKTVFCLAEDRRGAEVGLELAILSLRAHCPGSRVILYRPESVPEFVHWLEAHPEVELRTREIGGSRSWNCKPHALLEVLGEVGGESEVVWLDSDLVVTGDLRALFAGSGPEVLGITQEPLSSGHQGTEVRTRGWGLPVGTPCPHSLNSCVLRVTARHEPLLRRWVELMATPEYAAASGKSVDVLPPHLWSDQDVLAALVGSAEFQWVRLRVLRHGMEVLHTGGALAFSLRERAACFFRPEPVVLHAIGVKPWVLLGRPAAGGWFGWLRRVLQETSPYVHHVRRYRSQVNFSMAWCDEWTWSGRLINGLALGHWALRSWPLAVVAWLLNSVRRRPVRG